MIRFLPVPFALALVACTTSSGATPGSVGSGTDQVVVEPGPVGDVWQATWYLSRPARELRFERPANGFRESVFTILTPGYYIQRDGESEVLRTDDEPARVIRTRFPAFDQQLRRDYEFFRVFSDGGVAIFTGHLVARPLREDGAGSYVRDFRFEPPDGAGIIVHGKRKSGSVELTTGERGTYVYMGSVDPVASEDVISILDPGLPEWVAVQTEGILPRLFAFYRARLKARPATKPMVLFDYHDLNSPGASSGGGTLPGLIQLSIQGAGWVEPSKGALLQLLQFAAHEAAHMWNGEIAHYPGGPDAWMHEGGADAMADRALLNLQVIDQNLFLDRQTRALNACRVDLEATSIRASLQEGRPRTAYTCGNMMALLTESALRPHGADLFVFWQSLIRTALDRGGEYGVTDYLRVWENLGATSADTSALRRFLDGTSGADALIDELEARGVIIERAEPTRSYALRYGRETMIALMSADCGGRVGFRPTGGTFLLDADVSCGSLVGGAQVLRIDSFDAVGEGHRAYDRVREVCASGGTLRVLLQTSSTGERRTVEIPCERPLPLRPEYVRLRSI